MSPYWDMRQPKCHDMSRGGTPDIDSIKELQIWMIGQFDLVYQAQSTQHEDMKAVRQRVHDLAGDVAKIVALDLPAKFLEVKENDTKLEKLRTEAAERKGAIAALKATYAVGGALVGIVASVVFELAKVIHL